MANGLPGISGAFGLPRRPQDFFSLPAGGGPVGSAFDIPGERVEELGQYGIDADPAFSVAPDVAREVEPPSAITAETVGAPSTRPLTGLMSGMAKFAEQVMGEVGAEEPATAFDFPEATPRSRAPVPGGPSAPIDPAGMSSQAFPATIPRSAFAGEQPVAGVQRGAFGAAPQAAAMAPSPEPRSAFAGEEPAAPAPRWANPDEIAESPTMKAAADNPSKALEQVTGQSVDSLMAEMEEATGRSYSEELGLDKDDKARLLMELGFRMMAAGQRPGAGFFGSLGQAGMGTMQSYRAKMREKREERRERTRAEQAALRTRIDVAARREQMAARERMAADERTMREGIAGSDRDARMRIAEMQAEIDREKAAKGVGAPNIEKIYNFYVARGLSPDDALEKAEQQGRSSRTSVRSQAVQASRKMEPYQLEEMYPELDWGGDRAKALRQAQTRYVDDYMASVFDRATPAPAGAGAPEASSSWPIKIGSDGRPYRVNPDNPAEYVPYAG